MRGRIPATQSQISWRRCGGGQECSENVEIAGMQFELEFPRYEAAFAYILLSHSDLVPVRHLLPCGRSKGLYP